MGIQIDGERGGRRNCSTLMTLRNSSIKFCTFFVIITGTPCMIHMYMYVYLYNYWMHAVPLAKNSQIQYLESLHEIER